MSTKYTVALHDYHSSVGISCFGLYDSKDDARKRMMELLNGVKEELLETIEREEGDEFEDYFDAVVFEDRFYIHDKAYCDVWYEDDTIISCYIALLEQ